MEGRSGAGRDIEGNSRSNDLSFDVNTADILEGIADGFYAIDRDWRFLYANRRACEMWGVARETVIGRVLWERFPEIAGTPAGDALRQAVADGRPLEFEVFSPVVRRWLWLRAHPIRDGITGVYWRDITARKQAEAERDRLLSDATTERARLEAVVQHMPIGVILAEAPSGRLILANEAARRIWRHASVSAAGTGDYRAYRGFHPDGRAYAPEEWPLIRSLATGEIVTREEIEFQRGDGTRGVMIVHSAPIRDAAGRIMAGVAAFVDISERKRAEQELHRFAETLEQRVAARTRELAEANQRLRESEERYRSLYARTPSPMHVLDAAGRITEVNDYWLDLLGYERDEVIGRPVTDFMTEAASRHIRRLARENWAGLLTQGDLRDAERQFIRKSGEVVDVLLSGHVERDAAGKLLAIMVVIVDISARRKAERERDRYFEMSEDLLVIAGFDGYCRDFNPAVVRAVGRPREEILPTPFIEFVHPDDQPVVGGALERLGRGEPLVQFEIRYRHHEGWHWSAWNVTAIREEGILYGVGRDIHDRRQAELALRQAQKMEAVGQLTGGVAHDFNNLLTAIMGNLEMIAARAPAEDPTKRLADAALRAAIRGTRLTEHLLSFARRRTLRPELVDINEMLGEVKALCRKAVGEGIDMALRLPPDLWRCHLDPAQFEAAVLNLALNARDAMNGSGVLAVEAANVTVGAPDALDLQPGNYVRVSVSDTGCGMSPEVLARACEPFYTTKDVGRGSGLGLSQVYGFAKQSGGAVRIESTPGMGTTVHLYLPMASGTGGTAVVPASDLAPAPGGSAVILVVEDDEDVRQTAVDTLGQLGYGVLIAGSGPEALSILRGGEPVDVLFSDIVMPGGISGIDLARAARRLRPGLGVLLSSGYPGTGPGRSEVGVEFPFIAKPYRPAALGSRLEEVLAARPPGGGR